jgi:hypothetical protein
MRVLANRFWNDTECDLVSGVTYRVGWKLLSPWKDNDVPSNPGMGNLSDPLLLRLFAFTKRCRSAPFLALIGCVDRRKDTYVRLFDGKEFTASRSGRLWVFANDTPLAPFYANNHGELDLSITPLDV